MATTKKTSKTKATTAKATASGDGLRTGTKSDKRLGQVWAEIFAANAKVKLTDEAILKLMQADFPNNEKIDLKRIKDMRWYYNKGKLGVDAPAEALPAFDSNGEVVARLVRQTSPEVAKAKIATLTARRDRVQDSLAALNTRIKKLAALLPAKRVGK